MIRRGGLNCLKVKLRGNDAAWDYDRFVKVGVIRYKLSEIPYERRNGYAWYTDRPRDLLTKR